MKRKSIKKAKSSTKKPILDLFGDVPVTWPEVYLWCEVITRGKYSLQNRNLEAYIQGYAVIEKIKKVKLQHSTLEQYFAVNGEFLPLSANDSLY